PSLNLSLYKMFDKPTYFHRKLQNTPANSSATVKFWKNSKKHRNLLSFSDNFSLFRTAYTAFCPFFCTFYFIRLSSSFICKSKRLKFFVSAISFRRLFRQSPSQNKKHSPERLSPRCAL
ncbi:MAG: hypothetical protein U0M25_09835, partial [Oscillospiraceae bacterium]|nr:hypothetical protein [Oscillospiraceae bacterium]